MASVFAAPHGSRKRLTAFSGSQLGAPIEGLYAVANDATAVTGGNIISGGCTIGPAMTFGYLAALHAAGTARAC